MKKMTQITAGCLLAALLAFAPAALAQEPKALKSITTQMDGPKLIVTVAVSGAFTREVSFLTSPKRLVVDLIGVSAIEAAPYAQVGQAGVLDIRTGQYQPETARVVFDLGAATPAYTVTEVPGGLKISFWLEAGEETVPAQPVAGEPAAREPDAPRPAKERKAREPQAEAEPGAARSGMFFRAGGGWAFFLKPYEVETEFTYYGETASGVETHNWKSGLAIEAAIGKYMTVGSMPTKAGLEFSYWEVKPEFGITMSLPHPFLSNTYRDVDASMAEGLATKLYRVSLFAEFSLLESSHFTLSLGPVAGLTLGQLLSASDYGIDEVAPYAAENVTVGELTVQQDSLSVLHFGAMLGLEYRLGRHLALSLDTKLLLFSPRSAALTESFNMMHVQPTLSLQYNF
jgi:hypothetical protein